MGKFKLGYLDGSGYDGVYGVIEFPTGEDAILAERDDESHILIDTEFGILYSEYDPVAESHTNYYSEHPEGGYSYADAISILKFINSDPDAFITGVKASWRSDTY